MNNSTPSIVAAAMVLAGMWGGSLSATSPPGGGTISIEARADDPDASMRPFVVAAGEALGAKGFTILPEPGHAAYVAELTLMRVDLGTSTAKALTGSKSSITPGAVPGLRGPAVASVIPEAPGPDMPATALGYAER